MTAATAPDTSRAAHRALWTLQILLGVFLVVGSSAPKFVGETTAVEMFTDIGAGQWLRYLVGVVELAGGIGLLVSRLAGPAAVGLMAFMVGAAYTQAFVLGNPMMVSTPAIIFALCALIAWGRRDSIIAFFPER